MGGCARVLTTMLAAGSLAVPGLAAVIPDSLSIRVYDNAGVLAGDRAQAVARATEILARAGFRVEWRDCPAGRGTRACRQVPAHRELLVRLVRAPAAAVDAHVLGHALIDEATGRGTLATVFVDRIEALVGEAGADRAGMMGRVIAHEIGHLLLGTNAHSGTGLMRGRWSLGDLRRDRAEDWLFTGEQGRRMRVRRTADLQRPEGNAIRAPGTTQG